MSTSSYGSNRSGKSAVSASARSEASVASAQSWFSIGSLSNFQAGGVMDSATFARAPRVRQAAVWFLKKAELILY